MGILALAVQTAHQQGQNNNSSIVTSLFSLSLAATVMHCFSTEFLITALTSHIKKKKKFSLLFFLSLYRAKCRLKMPNVDVDNGVKMKRNIAKPVTCCSSTDPKAFLNYLLCFPCSLICVHKSCYSSKWSVLFAVQ